VPVVPMSSKHVWICNICSFQARQQPGLVLTSLGPEVCSLGCSGIGNHHYLALTSGQEAVSDLSQARRPMPGSVPAHQAHNQDRSLGIQGISRDTSQLIANDGLKRKENMDLVIGCVLQ
jgi:hypothetical protein